MALITSDRLAASFERKRVLLMAAAIPMGNPSCSCKPSGCSTRQLQSLHSRYCGYPTYDGLVFHPAFQSGFFF